ncbi:MAG: hypothetical protein M1814_002566 [Vezdaea aestivalis]|nr:MAG: hypothetical protein M1814_002566 [Vezdaea aestivalis]
MEETAEDPLMERLKDHSKVFNGLLSLIPAKIYYGKDNSDQWQRKKQTKQQAREAKFAKLDPNSFQSAKDVQDEKERKRKRSDDEPSNGEDDGESARGDNMEKPLEGMKRPKKKPRASHLSDPKNVEVEDVSDDLVAVADPSQHEQPKPSKRQLQKQKKVKREASHRDETLRGTLQAAETISIPASERATERLNENGAVNRLEKARSSNSPPALPTPSSLSPTFDALHAESISSSASSVVPPNSKVPFVKRNIPAVASDELKARLASKIAALRAKRKADDGSGAKTRHELMESRRRKQEQRKARKQEQKKKEKEEERIKRDTALQASLRNPPSSFGSGPNSIPVMKNPNVAGPETNLAFGRIAFDDGQRLDPTLSKMLNTPAKKGPSTLKGSLQSAEAKQERLLALDDDKRATAIEKNRWFAANKRVLGEKVRDDPNLLKKALKRKENERLKRGKEWTERLEHVDRSRESKQKRREENLQKRRDDKATRGKGGKKPGKKGNKLKPRPGFEGTFRSGGGKKMKSS